MEKAQKIISILLIAAILMGVGGTVSGYAQTSSSDTGDDETRARTTILVVDITEYEWWLIRWESNFIVCQIKVDHEGVPTAAEIERSCGTNLYKEWSATKACDALTADPGAASSCLGLYLFFVGSKATQKTIEVELPQPSIGVSLSGCKPSFPENRCPTIPSLLLTGIEPLPNETITAIHYIVNGIQYTCLSSTCEVALFPTPVEGTVIDFWGDSSFGDSTEHFTAQVRVLDTGISVSPGFYVDVLSSQWTGRSLATCSWTWQSFPPVGGPPLWLSTPEVPELIATEEPYYFLAGRLIDQGVVDASICINNGLLPNGYADECGLAKALSQVEAWQNQFDLRIIEVANKTGVPAQLLKNLFAVESQFWPGIYNTEHLGLGHITDNGADVLLLWNSSFYKQFCPLVLSAEVCSKGYVHLDPGYQALLRGALASEARTDCVDCPTGIDLSSANASIDLFAQTLLANCEQVGQAVYNASKKTPGSVSSYEDLWKFTVANYHAGPGCLSYALYTAWARGDPLDWEHVTQYFTPVCQGVIGYVDKIAR